MTWLTTSASHNYITDDKPSDAEADDNDEDEVPAGAEAATSFKTLAAHTGVLCDDCKPRAESEPLDVPSLSLPGTPSNTDGSSFDSNASANRNKALLSSPRPGEDEKPAVWATSWHSKRNLAVEGSGQAYWKAGPCWKMTTWLIAEATLVLLRYHPKAKEWMFKRN